MTWFLKGKIKKLSKKIRDLEIDHDKKVMKLQELINEYRNENSFMFAPAPTQPEGVTFVEDPKHDPKTERLDL